MSIEERIPASECENDSSPAKHSKRVSWSMVVETDDFFLQGRDTTPSYNSDRSEEICPRTPEPPFETTYEIPSILKPATETPFAAIETTAFETTIHNDCEIPTISKTDCDKPKDNAIIQDSCITNMDPQKHYLPSALVDPTPNDAEQSAIIHQRLLRRVSWLKQVTLLRRQHDFAQKGKFLVKEYELKTELEALCEDVLFLGVKKDRLAETLRELRTKKADILCHSNDGDKSERNDEGGIYQTKITADGTDNGTGSSTGVSDACVQTDDWRTGSGA